MGTQRRNLGHGQNPINCSPKAIWHDIVIARKPVKPLKLARLHDSQRAATPTARQIAMRPHICHQLLLRQRLEDRVRSVLVEVDADLGPQVVRKVIELPACCNRHQDPLRLLVGSQLDKRDGIGD